MMPAKDKRMGVGLEVRTFYGKKGEAFLVFKTPKNAYHVFKEVEAKDAARQCGATGAANTRSMWARLWNSEKQD